MDALDIGSSVGLLHLFGDATRVRLMALLEREELSVAEICAITELPQSRVSTHLGKLREAGVLADRREGASAFYRVNEGSMPEHARRVWETMRDPLRDRVLESDRARCAALVAARAKAERWPDAIAGHMERHYSPGRTWESLARGLVGLVRLGDVLDVGAGDGTIAELLAGRARCYTCLDRSARMVDAARQRLRGRGDVRVVEGDMHALPFGDGSFDQVLLFNVLAYSDDPPRVVREATRVLRPGGTMALVTLAAHERIDVASSFGHVQPGFAPAALRRTLRRSGLDVVSCAITSRERREPGFEVVTAFAEKTQRKRS